MLAALLVLGLGVVAHSVYAVASARREPAPFAVTAPGRASAPSTRPPSVPRSPTSAGAPTRSGRATAATVAFVPGRLRIAGLHVDAKVVSVLSGQRSLAPPDNPSQVGWWMASSLAGSASGSTVIVGHIDSATSGPGALFDLDHVKAGQNVALSDAVDTTQYRVTSLHYYRKTTGLPASLFNPSGPARLVLISCGGTFDAVKHSYRSNVVVVADPVATGSSG